MSGAAVGELVKEWHARRRRSQMDLAIEVLFPADDHTDAVLRARRG